MKENLNPVVSTAGDEITVSLTIPADAKWFPVDRSLSGIPCFKYDPDDLADIPADVFGQPKGYIHSYDYEYDYDDHYVYFVPLQPGDIIAHGGCTNNNAIVVEIWRVIFVADDYFYTVPDKDGVPVELYDAVFDHVFSKHPDRYVRFPAKSSEKNSENNEDEDQDEE